MKRKKEKDSRKLGRDEGEKTEIRRKRKGICEAEE